MISSAGFGFEVPAQTRGYHDRNFKSTALVNFRFGNLPRAGEEIEVAAFVGLADMSGEHGPVAAQVAWWRRLPGRLATSEFSLADVQMNAARRHVDLDGIPGAHECQRPADEALRRHVKNAGAVAGAAHASVRDPHHVAYARLYQLLGDRKHAPFRHAGSALGARILQHDDVVGRDREIVALDLARHVVVILEGEREPAMLEETLVS